MRKTLFFLIFLPLVANSQCLTKNIAFKSGEKLTYQVYYNWGFIWMNAGEATFQVDTTIYNSKKAFLLQSNGQTYEKYDWFFKVRDSYKSIVDRETLLPMKFTRNISEGGDKIDVTNIFDYRRKTIYNFCKSNKKPMIIDTLKLTPCTFDVLSIIYYTRNIDFSKSKPNDKIPITIILDNEIHQLHIRYLGIETIKDKAEKSHECIKFKPLLVDGTIFKGGEDMTVWVSNNKNKIPILVEANILVGSVKVYLSEMKGIRWR